MQILDHSKLQEDEFKVEYPSLPGGEFGRGIVPVEDDTYHTIVQSSSLQVAYILIQHEDIRDISAQTASSATIGTLAIRSMSSMVPISDIIRTVDRSIWKDDYSNDYPMEVRIESKKKEYDKEPLYQDLYRIYRECSESGWDSYHATPISERAFFEATKLLDLLPSDLPLPEVAPEPTGGIAFEWYKGKKHVFVISVSGKTSVSYAGLFGKYSKTYGAEYFFDELPRPVVDNVLRLFS